MPTHDDHATEKERPAKGAQLGGRAFAHGNDPQNPQVHPYDATPGDDHDGQEVGTFPHEKNKANIEINTTRFNNEIIKQRLSCIPIHITDTAFDYQN